MSTEPKNSLDERPLAIEEILDLFRDIGRCMHRETRHSWLDITMPQLKTLLTLYSLEKASMSELAEALGTGVSTITGIFDRLVEHGLVVREEDPHDRRVVVGRLTPAGAEVVDRFHLTARDRLGRVLAELTPDELRVVARAAVLLRNAARRAFAGDSPDQHGQ
ncbi:MAG TPA: MarR family transcriptional regulator [Chloroflexota bacterium]|jgi:DNA-binding MarR family transcriptional regulator|nr:MarR family transcriptional regulator [Chloroflexota bacterium]